MLSVPLCIPLSAGAVITEGPVTDDGVVEMLARRHPIADEWVVLMSENYVVTPPFLDDRQNCPVPAYTPSILHLQEPRLPVTPLYRHLTHPSLEYKIIAAKIDEVIAANEKRLDKATTSPSIIEVANDGVAASVRSTSSTSSIVTEVNERMSLFTSILFSFPVYDADGTLLRLVPSSLTNEVKEIFAESSSTSE